VYYCSLEYGPEDVRSSVGYYNMGRVFSSMDDSGRATSCNDMVVKVWLGALCRVVLGVATGIDGGMEPAAPSELPIGRLQLMEVVDMLVDIARARATEHGPSAPCVGDVAFVAALALIQLQEVERAREQLAAARAVLPETDLRHVKLLDMAGVMLDAVAAVE